jgi:hypothetical protein
VAGIYSYDGYQTVQGFEATSHWKTNEGAAVESHLEAHRANQSLITISGLYDISTRTWWQDTSSNKDHESVDWIGEAAVVEARDSIWVDLYLENASGGTTGAYFHGPLAVGGGFALETNGGSKLTGVAGNGRLNAKWVDSRDNGSFVGTLEGGRK